MNRIDLSFSPASWTEEMAIIHFSQPDITLLLVVIDSGPACPSIYGLKAIFSCLDRMYSDRAAICSASSFRSFLRPRWRIMYERVNYCGTFYYVWMRKKNADKYIAGNSTHISSTSLAKSTGSLFSADTKMLPFLFLFGSIRGWRLRSRNVCLVSDIPLSSFFA